MSDTFTTLILAAGLGKRMKSALPKILHEIAGRPLVHYVIDLAREVGSDRIILIIGHKQELVRECTAGIGVEYAVQAEQLGTGHAVQMCRELLTGYDGDLLTLSGDVPLLRRESVQAAWQIHRETQAVATVFTFKPDDPKGYGRIVRGPEGELRRIVEHKDADAEERRIQEVNGGIYFFRSKDLFNALEQVNNDNAAKEYYLTDTISLLRSEDKRVSAYLVEDPLEMAGVNSPEQLTELERYFLDRRRMG